jgi:hypothetical protein
MTSTDAAKPPYSPKALTGSAEAKRKAAIILEALAGLRTIQSASTELEIALPRYYVLETRMLQAMVNGLEPRLRGRKRNIETELKQLSAENENLLRGIQRLQALYRATQRAVGIKEGDRTKKAKGKTTKTRRANVESRGHRVSKALRDAPSASTDAADTLPAQTQGGQT